MNPSASHRSRYALLATGTYRIRPSGCTRQPGIGPRSVVTAPITVPVAQQPGGVVLSSIRTSNSTSGSRSNTAANQVAIESALTAIATRTA